MLNESIKSRSRNKLLESRCSLLLLFPIPPSFYCMQESQASTNIMGIWLNFILLVPFLATMMVLGKRRSDEDDEEVGSGGLGYIGEEEEYKEEEEEEA